MLPLIAQTSPWESILKFILNLDVWIFLACVGFVYIFMIILFYLFYSATRGDDAIYAAKLAIFWGWLIGGASSIIVYYYVWWKTRQDGLHPDWQTSTLAVIWGVFGIACLIFFIVLIGSMSKRKRAA